MKRRQIRLRRWLSRTAGVVGGAMMIIVGGGGPASAQAGDRVRIATVDSGSHPMVTLMVEPPAALDDVQLPPEAFTLTENGKDLPVTVEQLGSAGSAQHLNVVLVMDTSGSMKGAPLEAAKVAAQAFVSSLPEGTHIGVVAFGDAPYVVAPVGSSPGESAAAIGNLQAAGETALYDAVVTGLADLGVEENATDAVVVLSDGGDTASVTTLDEVIAQLGASRAAFNAIEFLSPEYDGSGLRAMAGAKDGLVLSADEPSRLQGLYAEVATNLLNQYAVTYTTEVGGDTEVSLAVEWDGVRSVTARSIRLPGLTAPLSVEAPHTSVAPGPGWFGSSGALLVGLGLAFVGLVAVLASVFTREREAKVRLARGLWLRRARVHVSTANDLVARAASVAERQLERHGRDSALYAALDAAGVDLRPGEFVVLALMSAVMAFAVGGLFVHPLVGVGLGAVVAFTFPAVLRHLGRRRRGRFADQLADTLQLVTGSLRAGHSILQAMDTVADDAPSPTREEFQRLVVETRLGRDLPDALRAMHDRIGNEDFEWFVQALQIHREVGGDLAQILDTVANTVRERSRLRRHVRTLSAEGRLSAVILFVLPILVGLAVAVMTPGYLDELFRGVGLMVLGAAVLLMTGGFFWLRRMIRLDF